MSKRWFLWSALALLVMALLGVLVWLAGRYEVVRWQEQLEHDVQEAGADIRTGLLRNVQSIQALTQPDANIEGFAAGAHRLMQERRELLRIEWRDGRGRLLDAANTPYRPTLHVKTTVRVLPPGALPACLNAVRASGPAYGPSEYVPQGDGTGVEQLLMCLPLVRDGHSNGFVLATYAMPGILSEWIDPTLGRNREISFTEGDGARLATHGRSVRGSRSFTAHILLDLPGAPVVLRMDSWRSAPDLFPNVLTALVATLTMGLALVMVLLGRDMRKRQIAEKELADALAFRKAMEDSLVTGLRARDTHGRITYVNPAFCEMVGYEAHELIGQSAPVPYWPPEQVEEYQRRQAVRLAGNRPPREGFESVFMRKGGERFAVLIFEAPLINAKGEQTGWMSAILDVSEQRRIEELSRTSQERLQATARLATVGEMASLLSHELNQPLAAISSYANGSINLLQQAPPEFEFMSSALHRIAEQAERAGKVIKSVNDFVRRRNLERQRVRPSQLLDDVLPLVMLQAKKLGVRVRVACPQELPPALCDRTMVEQVLLNLARNGVQAMADVPLRSRELVLTVTLQEPGRAQPWLRFDVSDAGAGIPADVAQQLFTPFFTTKAEGMGLGLSLCRTVVEQHGGLLEYQARAPQGTVFTFTLPVATDEGMPQEGDTP